MIPFNITLLIQMGNFLIAWWVLDRFFFRVCVAQVHHEQHAVRALEQGVITKKIELSSVQHLQRESHTQSRMLFAQSLPAVSQDLSPKVIAQHPFVHFKECDISTQHMVSDQMVTLLVKRITHGS